MPENIIQKNKWMPAQIKLKRLRIFQRVKQRILKKCILVLFPFHSILIKPQAGKNSSILINGQGLVMAMMVKTRSTVQKYVLLSVIRVMASLF